MSTAELIHYSLSFSFDLLQQLVSDLTQEQADWKPPGIANPISNLYWHTISYVDQLVHNWGMGQQPPLQETAGWEDKVVLASPPVDEDDPYGHYWAVREGLRVDLPALHEYARATSQTILDWVASLTPEDMGRTVETTLGELSLAQMLELYIIGHINSHIGEISALRGCQGLKGYPW
jgi:hypothetical protein